MQYLKTHEESAGPPASQQGTYGWCNVLAKFSLLFFGIVLWYKMSIYFGYGLLVLAWVLDGGLHRSRQMIKEPLVLAILFFCAVLVLGILWSDYPNSGRIRWNKYVILTVFIPYLSLLNKERLFWAIGGLVIGYSVVLLMGIYYRFFLGEQGIPPLKMAYLHFSMMLGIGVILISYLAATSSNKKIRGLLWGWFQTLRAHRLTTLGIALVCFIFLAGITDVLFIYGQIPSLLLVITAIAIGWKEAELCKVTQTIR